MRLPRNGAEIRVFLYLKVMKILKLLTLFLLFYPKLFSQDSTKTNDTLVKGKASYYASKFNGRKTSNGEIFRNDSLTAAHKTLPFGTIVRVVNLKNNKEVIVRINDRLPQTSKRIIDLSQTAARELGMIRKGIENVGLQIIKQ